MLGPYLIQLLILHKLSVCQFCLVCRLIKEDCQLMQVSQLTCRHDDPLLLCGTAGWGGSLGADARLWVWGLVWHRGPIIAHVSGTFSDAAVHRGLAAKTYRDIVLGTVLVLLSLKLQNSEWNTSIYVAVRTDIFLNNKIFITVAANLWQHTIDFTVNWLQVYFLLWCLLISVAE